MNEQTMKCSRQLIFEGAASILYLRSWANSQDNLLVLLGRQHDGSVNWYEGKMGGVDTLTPSANTITTNTQVAQEHSLFQRSS